MFIILHHNIIYDAYLQVIKGSEDNPSQYLNLMNVIFTAQKHVIIVSN